MPSPSSWSTLGTEEVTKRDGRWYVEAVLNARKLTLERQAFFDDVDALPAEAQGQVSNLIAALRQRHPG